MRRSNTSLSTGYFIFLNPTCSVGLKEDFVLEEVVLGPRCIYTQGKCLSLSHLPIGRINTPRGFEPLRDGRIRPTGGLKNKKENEEREIFFQNKKSQMNKSQSQRSFSLMTPINPTQKTNSLNILCCLQSRERWIEINFNHFKIV